MEIVDNKYLSLVTLNSIVPAGTLSLPLDFFVMLVHLTRI